MGFVNDMDQLGRMTANTKLIEHLDRVEREHRAQTGETTRSERIQSAAAKRKADADVRRAVANNTPLSPALRTTLIVLAVLSALTVVGLPITALIVWGLHLRSPKVIARRVRAQAPPIDREAEARRADDLGLTESARMWRQDSESA